MDDLIRRSDAKMVVSGDGKYFGHVARSFNEFEVIAWMPLPEPMKEENDEDGRKDEH